MVYHVDNPVEIKQEFSREVTKEAIEYGLMIYAQMYPEDVPQKKLSITRVQTAVLPAMLLAAREALEQHECVPTADTAERLVEIYDSLRWNEQTWRDSGDEVFRTYQQLCREIEEHC
jgi:hypothetical protein